MLIYINTRSSWWPIPGRAAPEASRSSTWMGWRMRRRPRKGCTARLSTATMCAVSIRFRIGSIIPRLASIWGDARHAMTTVPGPDPDPGLMRDGEEVTPMTAIRCGWAGVRSWFCFSLLLLERERFGSDRPVHLYMGVKFWCVAIQKKTSIPF